ncbi:MAG TPA: DRTGG domain-containing protein [Bacilli bacterium]
MTKHEQLLQYIEGLKVSTKISVRKMAKDMDVSEGTAYRAIKEAESLGLVATKERIGTVRIEKAKRMNIYQLTFADVVHIVDGTVLGGFDGLDKNLNKFVIGAMEQDAMKSYIEADSLLIVGNRNEAHTAALQLGAGVLITGGFGTTQEVIELADKKALPVITCGYDTFTVASMINRAIYDSLIKKKILLVEDILTSRAMVATLKVNHTINDWRALVESTGHSRFPVIDEWNRVIGMLTAKDVVGADGHQTIERFMTRNPLTVNAKTSVTAAAHMMVWEGIELIPVVDANRKLIGVISRRDVLKAIQYIQREPQLGETIEDSIVSGFAEVKNGKNDLLLRGSISPQMVNHLGTASEGILTTLMAKAALAAIKEHKKGDLVMENITIYFVRPVQIDSVIEIHPRMIEVSRKFGKAEITVECDGHVIAKAMLTAQIIEH